MPTTLAGACAMLLALLACSAPHPQHDGTEEGDVDAETSTNSGQAAVADSTLAEAAGTEEATNTEVVKPLPDAPTYDLAFFDLRGHVKTLDEDGEIHSFTRDGRLIGEVNVEGESWEPFAWERDAKGLITRNGNGHYTFTYGPGKRLATKTFKRLGLCEKLTYLYDERGLRVGVEVESTVDSWEERDIHGEALKTHRKHTVKYKNFSYDSHMNWTLRTDEDKTRSRKITYYK